MPYTQNSGQARESTVPRMRRQKLKRKPDTVCTQLSEVRKEAEQLQSRKSAQDAQLANTEVKAPANGVVVGTSVFTKGGVVGPGAKLMEIVPADDPLIVEGQLPVNLVDKVQVGLPVELIFSAFNANKTPHVPGEIINVAADRSVDEKTGAAYYHVRVKVSPAGAKMIAEHKLNIVPGMPAELFVKTGERTMMSYLFKPLFDRAHSSMSEE